MVCFHSPISVDQQTEMAEPCLKLRQTKPQNSPNHHHHHHHQGGCQRSRSAIVDVVILIAVICAFGFLVFPYIKLITIITMEFWGEIMFVMKEEISKAPMIYGCLGLSIMCAVIALLAITLCTTSRKCGKSGCRGLRKAAEFDIQLETEDCAKNSSNLVRNGVKKGLFTLPRDHHRELEAELKKMAPPNGRAVLVFRGRCGCSVGRMEVPGAKKNRKVKK